VAAVQPRQVVAERVQPRDAFLAEPVSNVRSGEFDTPNDAFDDALGFSLVKLPSV
jgi:hypothetical protein